MKGEWGKLKIEKLMGWDGMGCARVATRVESSCFALTHARPGARWVRHWVDCCGGRWELRGNGASLCSSPSGFYPAFGPVSIGCDQLDYANER